MKQKPIIRGIKMYKVINDDEVEIVRVIRKKDEHHVVVVDDSDYSKSKIMTADELSNYHKLNPHGIFVLAIVEIGKNKKTALKDVVTMIGRRSEDTDYAMCRQNIVNPLYQSFSGIKRYGFSISRDTCPSYVNYSDAKAYDSVLKIYKIDIYRDDTEDKIFSIAKTAISNCNKILSDNKQLFKKNEDFVDNLSSLYKEHDFWELFDSMFEIKPLVNCVKDSSLSLIQINYLESMLAYKMLDIDIIPYWYDINFSNIMVDYMLVRDESNKVYVITYTKGDFIQPQHLSAEEIIKFTSVNQ